jgi:amidase
VCATAVLNKVHQAYLARIEEVNLKGPTLHAVLETNPHALAQAAVSDLERKVKGNHNLGLLHGIPILVKDNIATSHEDGRARFYRH